MIIYTLLILYGVYKMMNLFINDPSYTMGLATFIWILIYVLFALLHEVVKKKIIIYGIEIVYGIGMIFYPFLVFGIPVIYYRSNLYVVLITIVVGVYLQVHPDTLFICVMASITYQQLSALQIKNETLSKDLTKQAIQTTELRKEQESSISYYEEHVEIEVLKERNRIARDIHDSVGHILSRSLIFLGSLRLKYEDEELQEELDILKSSLDEGMTSMRLSVHNLHNTSIDINKEILYICNSLTPLQYSYTPINYDIPTNISELFLFIIKEALNNTIKHSDATHVSIKIIENTHDYILIIKDNGTTKEYKEGFGLSNFRSRVQKMNGIIHYNNENGFRIYVRIGRDDI